MKKSVTTLITDLDNTLFDLVDIWYRSFTAQLRAVAAEIDVPTQTLLGEFKAAHQRHGTSEFAFAVSELPSVLSSGVDVEKVTEAALNALDEARRPAMRLFPGVESTLHLVKSAGTFIVGYTESLPLYTKLRLVHMELDRLIDVLYTPPGHPLPAGVRTEHLARWTTATQMRATIHRETPEGELKPNPRLLRDIMNEVSADPERTVYVGDSPLKDVAMAQHAGVLDVWAKYGVAQHREQYELLRAVTHWTDEAVKEEKQFELLRPPTYTLESGFDELLDDFEFGTARRASETRSRDRAK